MNGSGVNMGSAYASIEVKLDQMRQARRDAPAIMQQMAGDVSRIADTLNKKLERDAAASAERVAKSAEQSARRAAEAAKRHFADMASSVSALGQKLTLGITLPVAGAGAAVLKAAMDMDSLERSLRAVTKGTEQFNREMRSAREISRLPGLGLSESIGGLVKLQSGGFKEGVAVETLKQVGNALATVGHGKTELAAVVEQISQMSGKSKILAEDVRLISQYIPQFRQAMAGAFGTSDTEKIGKMGLTVEDFFIRVNTQLDKLPRVTGGAKNAIENFSDASKVALAQVGNAILPVGTKILDTLTPAIEGAGKAFSKLPDSAKEAILGSAGIVALMGVATLAVGKFMETWIALKESAAAPLLFKITVVAVGFQVLKELIDFRMKQIEEAEERQAKAIRSIPSDATRNLRPFDPTKRTGTMGYQQFEIKPTYGKSVKDTLAAINAEQNRLAVTTGRRQALSRDAAAIIRDEENRLATEAKRRAAGNAVSLTGAGREAQLRQALKQAQEVKETLLNRISTAKTKTELNTLGGKLESARAREMSLEKQLEAFDPAKIADKMKEAAEKRKKAIEANAEAEIQVLERTGKKIEAARKKAQLDYTRDIAEGVAPNVAAAKRNSTIKAAYDELIKEMDAQEKRTGDLRKTALKMTTATTTAEFEVLKTNAMETLRVLADVADKHLQIEMKAAAVSQRVRDQMDREWELYLRTQPEEMEWFKPGEGLENPDPIKPGMPKINLPFKNPLKTTTPYQRQLTKDIAIGRGRNTFGYAIGEEIAYSLSEGLAKSLDKAMGKSDVGKIFSRAFLRLAERQLDKGLDKLAEWIGSTMKTKAEKKRSGEDTGDVPILPFAGFNGGSFPGMPMPTTMPGGYPQLPGRYGEYLNYAQMAGQMAKGQKPSWMQMGTAAGMAFGGPVGMGVGAVVGGVMDMFGLKFDDGGVVPGRKGTPRLVLAHAGETILPTHKSPMSVVSGGMGGDTIHLGGITVHAAVSNDYDVDRLAAQLERKMARNMEKTRYARVRR